VLREHPDQSPEQLVVGRLEVEVPADTVISRSSPVGAGSLSRRASQRARKARENLGEAGAAETMLL
jgi:hypothetical protein